QLIYWATLTYKEVLNEYFIDIVFNTLFISIVSTTIIIVVALIIANYVRIKGGMLGSIYSKITIIGYSIPGTVIAITVILFFNNVDRNLYWLYRLFDKNSPILVLSLSLAMLIFAYVVRFLAVGFQSIESGFSKVSKKFYEASKTLGRSTTQTFFDVDLPMLKPAIMSGAALVFVDIIKELPLALLLRPFNFDTLATNVFRYANDELIIRASIPSLAIILVAFIGIITINKISGRED
ncbi:MAG: ABC transporter permease, partial [Oscillospiraceae bacterium]